MKKTFKVELDIETMQDIIEVFRHYRNQPCRRKVMWELPDKLSNIIQNGCFKHNIMCETFEGIDGYDKITICPKCSPKKYKQYKKETKGLNLASNEGI